MYDIILLGQAEPLSGPTLLMGWAQNRIVDRLDQLVEDPLGPFTKPLTNAEVLRLSRVGT